VIAGFNDDSLGSLIGQGGGTGFASGSAWAMTVSGGGETVTSGDLSAPASSGYSLAQTGTGQQLYSSGSSSILTRTVAGSGLGASGQTIWFSFLAELDSGGRAGINIDDPQNSPYNRVLLRNATTSTSQSEVQLYIDGATSVSMDVPGTTSLVDAPLLVVGRLTLNTSGTKDTLDVWVNPDVTSASVYNAAVGAGEAVQSSTDFDTASAGVTAPGVQSVGVLAYAGGHLDNVIFSDDPNAYTEVTGFAAVPEPSSAALLGIAIGAAALMRRGRKA
jgi:hypothetical protein